MPSPLARRLTTCESCSARARRSRRPPRRTERGSHIAQSRQPIPFRVRTTRTPHTRMLLPFARRPPGSCRLQIAGGGKGFSAPVRDRGNDAAPRRYERQVNEFPLCRKKVHDKPPSRYGPCHSSPSRRDQVPERDLTGMGDSIQCTRRTHCARWDASPPSVCCSGAPDVAPMTRIRLRRILLLRTHQETQRRPATRSADCSACNEDHPNATNPTQPSLGRDPALARTLTRRITNHGKRTHHHGHRGRR